MKRCAMFVNKQYLVERQDMFLLKNVTNSPYVRFQAAKSNWQSKEVETNIPPITNTVSVLTDNSSDREGRSSMPNTTPVGNGGCDGKDVGQSNKVSRMKDDSLQQTTGVELQRANHAGAGPSTNMNTESV